MHMQVRDLWDELDSTTQKWLIDNPGCQLLPRTLSAKIGIAANGSIERDRHGQMMISKEDRDFIQAKAK
ncbi:MAG: hypothetical protein JWO49_1750 [Arthrobacter sp.]|nr:hypothetical protein [Arthrobacter sp.]